MPMPSGFRPRRCPASSIVLPCAIEVPRRGDNSAAGGTVGGAAGKRGIRLAGQINDGATRLARILLVDPVASDRGDVFPCERSRRSSTNLRLSGRTHPLRVRPPFVRLVECGFYEELWAALRGCTLRRALHSRGSSEVKRAMAVASAATT
jgi:hypothetical protein